MVTTNETIKPQVTILFRLKGQYASFKIDALVLTRHFAVHHYMRLDEDYQGVTANTSLYTVTCRHNGFKAATFASYANACECAKQLDRLMNWRIIKDADSLCKIEANVKRKVQKLFAELGGNVNV